MLAYVSVIVYRCIKLDLFLPNLHLYLPVETYT